MCCTDFQHLECWANAFLFTVGAQYLVFYYNITKCTEQGLQLLISLGSTWCPLPVWTMMTPSLARKSRDLCTSFWTWMFTSLFYIPWYRPILEVLGFTATHEPSHLTLESKGGVIFSISCGLGFWEMVGRVKRNSAVRRHRSTGVCKVYQSAVFIVELAFANIVLDSLKYQVNYLAIATILYVRWILNYLWYWGKEATILG